MNSFQWGLVHKYSVFYRILPKVNDMTTNCGFVATIRVDIFTVTPIFGSDKRTRLLDCYIWKRSKETMRCLLFCFTNVYFFKHILPLNLKTLTVMTTASRNSKRSGVLLRFLNSVHPKWPTTGRSWNFCSSTHFHTRMQRFYIIFLLQYCSSHTRSKSRDCFLMYQVYTTNIIKLL